MNTAGSNRVKKLARRTMSSRELQARLTLEHNMGLLCHCSGEIDDGLRRFFSVNNFHLGTEGAVLIVAAAFPPEDPPAQPDPFERSFIYELIGELLADQLTGRQTFYSAPIDGRLATLIPFFHKFTGSENEFVYSSISQQCKNISARCKEQYDLNVIFYVSQIIPDPRLCTAAYERLFSYASLHRFIGLEYIQRLYRENVIFYPPPRKPGPLLDDNGVESLAAALVAGMNPYPIATKVLDDILAVVTSIDTLKMNYHTQFESLVAALNLRGMNFNPDSMSEQIYETLEQSTDWVDLADFFYKFIASIHEKEENPRQVILENTANWACSYIDAHYGDPGLSLGTVAGQLGISSSHLSSAFLSVKQISLPAYIRNVRLSTALDMIRSTSRPIKDIAAQCGFTSIVTFYRVFKQKYGLPPGQIVRRAGEDTAPGARE